MKKILVIDDEPKIRNLLSKIISLEGFEVFVAKDLEEGNSIIHNSRIDLIFCDVKLPDGNGVDFTKKIKKDYPNIEIILLTAFGHIPDAVQAIKFGAFDYITKADDTSRIVPLLHRAIEKIELVKKVENLEKRMDDKFTFDQVIGNSKSILNVIELSKKVATSGTTVLLTGETGTGKEIFSRAIHNYSPRKNKNFVAVNCSAFTKELLESELFGHKAGAFTGALKNHIGLFEEADGGTIFLDEIGEMSLDLQAKLLRVIELGEYYRVGDNVLSKVDVRLIVATNRNLLDEIEKGNFREDLYYRISVFQIHLPSLSERINDLELLSYHFLNIYSNKCNKRIDKISPQYIEALKRHSWNGNIRELRNVIERSVILCDSSVLDIDTLTLDLTKNISASKQLSAFDLSSAEKLHIQKVMNYTNGNKTKTAELLGIALTTLYRKLTEYQIS